MIHNMLFLGFEVKMYIMILMLGCADQSERLLEDVSEVVVSHQVVEIPSGSFTMGCISGDLDCSANASTYNVYLTMPFAMMKKEVTQGLYKKVMGEDPSVFKGNNRPVENVSWYDAVTFANKLSEMEGREICYEIDGEDVQWNSRACTGWRLPTEAEWEYAARGGDNYIYAGSDNVDEVGWYDENSGEETQPVGQKKANGFGLYDMSGNVYEWVWDWYGTYPGGSQINPLGISIGSFRVLRGGYWKSNTENVLISYRDGYVPELGGSFSGFRLVRTL